MKCPNTSSPQWKELVNKIGVYDAMKEYLKYGDIPDASNYSESFKGVNSSLKIFSVLSEPKVQSLFTRFYNTNPDKFYQELTAIAGKQQTQILKEWNNTNKPTSLTEMQLGLLSEVNYIVEINTARESDNVYGKMENTNYYEKLTVPGGINYTENEIITPHINPSIKGHGKFSTNNAIGWFRSDEKSKQFADRNFYQQYLKEKNIQGEYEDIVYGNEFQNWVSSKQQEADIFDNSQVKTRRILELQSDLFQKGRDKDNLVTEVKYSVKESYKESGKVWIILQSMVLNDGYTREDRLPTLFKTKEEADSTLSEILEREKNPENSNKFLQLLNKDNNWTTFFIKSIIQDSTRRGYERILFPKGQTARKIEGLDIGADNVKLDPVEKFYDNAVTNILKKNYTVNEIIDEYGNGWNEVILEDKYNDTIFFEPQRQAEQEFESVNGMAFSNDLKDKLRAGLQQVTIRDRFHALGFYETSIGRIGVNPVAQQRVKLDYFAEEGETIEETAQRMREKFKGADDIIYEHIEEFFQNKRPLFVYNINLIDENSLFYQPADIISNPLALPVGELVAYRALKQQSLANVERELLYIGREFRELKAGPSPERRILNDRKAKMEELKETLSNEITILENRMEKSTTVLAPLIERDLQRAEELSQSTDPAAVSEATEITNFIGSLPRLVATDIEQFHYGEHPIYTAEEIDRGIPEDEQAILRDWAVRADLIRGDIARNNKNILLQTVNEAAGVDKLYGRNITIEDLKKPLKDTDYVSMYVMDISNGIFSHNGILPQVTQSVFSSDIEYAQAQARIDIQRIDAMVPRLEQAMRDMDKLHPGQFIKSLLFGSKSVPNYSIFFQQNKNGMFGKGLALVDLFSSDYWADKRKMNSTFNAAMKAARNVQDPIQQTNRYREAYDEKFRWVRNNEHIFDPRKLTALRKDPNLSMFDSVFGTVSEEEATAHESMLRSLLGENEFNKRVRTLQQYVHDFIELNQGEVSRTMSAENVTEYEKLSDAAKLRLSRFEQENSPFVLAQAMSTGSFPMRMTLNGLQPVYPKSISAYVSVPKSDKHYDSNYRLIHSNTTLSEFYDIARSISENMKGVFPPEIQNMIMDTTLHYTPRTSMEIMMAQEGTFFSRLFEVMKKMFRDVISIMGVEAQSELTYAHIDYISGQKNYKVNDSFITKNLNRIKAIYQLELAKFKTASELSGNLTNVSVLKLNDKAKAYLQDILGNKLNDYLSTETVNINKLLNEFANHQMVENSSMNLPKILKMYSNLASIYDARARVLPLMNNLKNHYEEIKNTALNNVGEETTNAQVGMLNNTGKRVRAISQFESWFNRNILDNKGVTEHQGTIKKEYESSLVKRLGNKLGGIISGRVGKVYGYDEKQTAKEIKAALAKVDPQLIEEVQKLINTDPSSYSSEQKKFMQDNEGIRDLLNTQNELGRFVSASSVLRGTQKFLVAKMLGLNFSSALTNFLEGQISNGIQASLGDSFPSEYINEVSAIDLISANLTARISNEGNMPEKIWILNKLIQRYDLFNDISQEIQKSTTESLYDSFVSRVLMSPTRKTEYLNQAPLIAAIMRDTKVVGKEGQESEGLLSVFTRVNTGTAKEPNYELQLKDEYNTPENQGAWLRENLTKESQKTYQELKQRIDQTIKNAHGDYNKFTGMKAKDSALGQSFLTLRSWLPRQLYIRFAPEQDDILIGTKQFKGFARSHTSVTALTVGALAGLMTGGVGLAVLGAGTAFGVNQIGLLGGGKWGAKSGAGVLNELAIMSQVLFKKMVGLPVNSITGITKFIHGKSRLIDTNSNLVYALKNGKLEKTDMQGILTSNNFTERDFKNFKANMQDIANILMMYGLFFATKALLWGDDDEDDSSERRWHNAMANRAIQLVGQATTYYNPYELIQQVNPNNTAVYKFLFQDLVKFAKDAATPGAIQTYGENAGENKAWTSFQKAFIPNIVSSPYTGGFDKQFKRQFVKSPLDKAFWGEEKNAKEEIREIRASEKVKYIDAGLTADEAKIKIKEKFGSKDKDQSYVDYLNEISNIQAQTEDIEED